MSEQNPQELLGKVLRELKGMHRDVVEKMKADAVQGRKYSDEDRALLYQLNRAIAALERKIVPKETWVQQVIKQLTGKDGG